MSGSRARPEFGSVGNITKGFSMTRVLSFTSGKGGVGKTSTVVNIALALAEQGRSVLILDGDFSLANVDLLLDTPVQFTLEHVLRGQKSLEEILIQHSSGVCFIPAGSGVESLSKLNSESRMGLFRSLEEVSSHFDYLLIDTPAGAGPDVTFFCSASHHVFFLVHPEPTSLTDSFALMKILSSRYGLKKFQIIMNCVSDREEAHRVFRTMSDAVGKYLQVEVEMFGFIPRDKAMSNAVIERKPIVESFPSSNAARSINEMARHIETDLFEYLPHGGVQFFFNAMLESVEVQY